MTLPKFWWFEGKTVAALTEQLAKHPGARLEVRPETADDGTVRLWLTVVPKAPTDATPGELDESWPCPPVCPS